MAKKSGTSGVLFGILGTAFAVFLALRMRGKKPFKTMDSLDWSPIENSEYSALLPYIIGQAKHETGNYTSDLFKRANNLFGMQKVYRRKNYQSGSTIAEGGKRFGTYSTPQKAMLDFLEYLRQWKRDPFPKSVSNARRYAYELKKRGYFGDQLSNYQRGIERWMKA